MANTTFLLQAFGGFLALVIVVALLQWTFSGGKPTLFGLARNALRRPLTWVIIVVQILFAVVLASGAPSPTRLFLVLFFWAVVTVVLGLVWRRKRTCPECGRTFTKTLGTCPACQVRRSYPHRGTHRGPGGQGSG